MVKMVNFYVSYKGDNGHKSGVENRHSDDTDGSQKCYLFSE